jgi:hypothetical protein
MTPPRYAKRWSRDVLPSQAAAQMSVAMPGTGDMDLDAFERASKVWERSLKLQLATARSLRLTAQSRVDPKTVGRQQPADSTPPLWDA